MSTFLSIHGARFSFSFSPLPSRVEPLPRRAGHSPPRRHGRSSPRAYLTALATPYRRSTSPHPAAPRHGPTSRAGRAPPPAPRRRPAAPAPHRGPACRGRSSPRRRFLAADSPRPLLAAPAAPRRGCSHTQTRRVAPAAPCPGHTFPAPPRRVLRQCQRMRRGERRPLFAFCLAGYVKWVSCLHLLLEPVLSMQKHCERPILRLGLHLPALLKIA